VLCVSGEEGGRRGGGSSGGGRPWRRVCLSRGRSLGAGDRKEGGPGRRDAARWRRPPQGLAAITSAAAAAAAAASAGEEPLPGLPAAAPHVR